MNCFNEGENLGILNGMRQWSNAFDNLGKTALTILPFSNQFHVELIHFLRKSSSCAKTMPQDSTCDGVENTLPLVFAK